ncbi:MAG: FAD-binding oxidoreductase [Chloroflexota bacterium]|nr:FAD-binding oxidoreductase [Chloroflexota bacterium]
MPIVNDVHSQLNETAMRRVVRPGSAAELQRVVAAVRDEGGSLSVAGGRHAMGGQQFLDGGTLLDMRGLNRIISLDSERGLLRVESGIMWSDLVSGLRDMQHGQERRWSIVQKQTGADRLSIGGALAANGHGRGLTYKPIVQDVESFDVVDTDGVLRHCSRGENAELFSLAIGGYGLFGVIYEVTLRLQPAHRVRRVVEITTIDRLESLFRQRIADGFTYGDFQYKTDETSPGFLRDGVMSCYIPVPEYDAPKPESDAPQQPLNILSEQDWRGLLYLSHADKARAFEQYAGFYMSTNGQIYDSDTFQLSQYIDDYHRELDIMLNTPVKGTETITELYVPLPSLADFMDGAARELNRRKANVIYGTIRLIERDDETFLNWARRHYACIVFNLHVDHTDEGIAQTADALRALIDLATERGGSYFLTYNKFATQQQLERCYPQFSEFLAKKREYDPEGVFSSDWLRAYSL